VDKCVVHEYSTEKKKAKEKKNIKIIYLVCHDFNILALKNSQTKGLREKFKTTSQLSK